MTLGRTWKRNIFRDSCDLGSIGTRLCRARSSKFWLCCEVRHRSGDVWRLILMIIFLIPAVRIDERCGKAGISAIIPLPFMMWIFRKWLSLHIFILISSSCRVVTTGCNIETIRHALLTIFSKYESFDHFKKCNYYSIRRVLMHGICFGLVSELGAGGPFSVLCRLCRTSRISLRSSRFTSNRTRPARRFLHTSSEIFKRPFKKLSYFAHDKKRKQSSGYLEICWCFQRN